MLKDELIKRALKDQEIRFAVQNPRNTSVTWKDVKVIDESNTAWLKNVIKKEGWPTISKVGEEASHAAWLIVQHADLDTQFQGECLYLLQEAWRNHDVNPRNLAYLTDRVAVNRGLEQTYGTQFSGSKPEEFVPHPIKEKDKLNERRAEMGLEPFELYEKKMKGEYTEDHESEKLGNFYISK